jgi:DNA-binding response OmpR family regulator
MIRIHHVLKTHRLNSSLKVGDVEIDLEAMSLMRADGHKELLAQKDFLILKHLIELSPKVLSRDEILNLVWGKESFPSNRTVDNAILRLRQSLGTEAGQWIRSVRGVGYQWLEPRMQEEGS